MRLHKEKDCLPKYQKCINILSSSEVLLISVKWRRDNLFSCNNLFLVYIKDYQCEEQVVTY